MNINDALGVAMRGARQSKEQQVRRGHRTGDVDIPATLTCYRGATPVAAVQPTGGREDYVQAARIGAYGFRADVVSLVNDSYHTTGPAGQAGPRPTNPITGRAWEPGEMQRVALEHDGVARGLVSEGIIVTVANRAGDLAAASIGYRRSGAHLLWGEEDTLLDGAVSGYIPASLRALMAEPDMGTVFYRETGLDVSGEVADAWADVATALRVTGSGRGAVVMLYAEPGTERERIVRRAFPRSVQRPPG